MTVCWSNCHLKESAYPANSLSICSSVTGLSLESLIQRFKNTSGRGIFMYSIKSTINRRRKTHSASLSKWPSRSFSMRDRKSFSSFTSPCGYILSNNDCPTSWGFSLLISSTVNLKSPFKEWTCSCEIPSILPRSSWFLLTLWGSTTMSEPTERPISIFFVSLSSVNSIEIELLLVIPSSKCAPLSSSWTNVPMSISFSSDVSTSLTVPCWRCMSSTRLSMAFLSTGMVCLVNRALQPNFNSTTGASPNSYVNVNASGFSQSPFSSWSSTGIGFPKTCSLFSAMCFWRLSLKSLLSSSAKTVLPYCFFTMSIGTFPFLNPGITICLRWCCRILSHRPS